MLRSLLNIKNAVAVVKLTETSDGMGGITTVSSTVTLTRANLWQVNSNDRLVCDKITKTSTHVLAVEYGAYSFTVYDRNVTYNGNTYIVNGNYDNVGERNELLLVGLTWQQ